MGSSTCSDIVPFVAPCVYESTNPYEKTPRNGFTRDVALRLCCPSDEECDDPYSYQGWSYQKQHDEIGKRKRLYANAWVKGEHRVWIINESEYAAGCDYQISLVADSSDSIAEFAKDWNIELRLGIEENDTVQQTL